MKLRDPDAPLRGFAAMKPERRAAVAAMGGRASAKVRAFAKKQVLLPGFEAAKRVRRTKTKTP